jgi:hypothetical protein
LIARRKDLDKSRKQVLLDLDVDPVRGRGCQRGRQVARQGGMERLRQDRNGAGSGPCFFLFPRFAYLRPSFLVLCFCFLSFLVSDLLPISSVYISLPHTCHTIPHLLINYRVRRLFYHTFFSVFYFRFYSLSFLSAPHVDDEASL